MSFFLNRHEKDEMMSGVDVKLLSSSQRTGFAKQSMKEKGFLEIHSRARPLKDTALTSLTLFVAGAS